MGQVHDMVVGRVDRTLRRAVVDVLAGVDGDRRRHVGPDFLLVLAEHDRDVDVGAGIGCGHFVERGAAFRGAGGAFLDGQKGFERRTAFLLQLGVGPGAVAVPQLRIVAVALAVGQPVLGRLPEHPAVRHCHAKDDLSHFDAPSPLPR